MNDGEFGCFKFLELKYRRGDQIIKPFCRIGSHQEISCPLFNLRKFQKIEKSSGESGRTHWNVMNDEEFDWLIFLELKSSRGDPIIQAFCRIGSHQEISSPLFNFTKFQKFEKSTCESCRTHWNLMNDEELESLKFLEWKYRKEDQIVQPFCRNGSHQEISSPLFNLRKFQKIGKCTGGSIATHWSAMNDEEFECFKFLQLKYRRGSK